MPKPTIIAVDDDRQVLAAVERDLRRKYGKEYRVVGAASGADAIKTIHRLVLRGEPIALLLVDQRMPEMTGVEFLARVMGEVPQAKRVLLTAYADTDVAIRAINEIRLDHYLLKPWDPPEERLYPVLDDLLADWQADFRPPFEGIRVIGTRWSPQAHALRDFLARNLLPYQWLDVETAAEAHRLLETSGADRLPVVILQDGTVLVQPTLAEVGAVAGLRVRATMPFYDLIVVGSGPAGLAAAVYGASEGLRTLVVEREAPGGQAGQSSRIENYLGFPVGLTGLDLARRAVAQAARFGAEILTPQEATALHCNGNYKILTLSDRSEVSGHALLVATGVSYRKLDVPGVEALAGAGVYYGAAITEALSVKDADAFVVGAGNSAGQAAMYLARFARTVTMLVRGASLAESLSRYLIDQIEATPNIKVLTRTHVIEAQGTHHLERLIVGNSMTGDQWTLEAAGLFIFIGAAPRTDWLAGVVERDTAGFVLTGIDLMKSGEPPAGWPLGRTPYWLETSVPGIFAAGDVRARSVKRIASAVGEGSMAIQFVHQYLRSL